MLVVGIDLETDSSNPDRAAVIEFAAVLYDTDAGHPLKIISSLINVERRLRPLPPHITGVTGITEEMLGRYGLLDEQYARILCQIRDKMLCHTDVIVMHNGTQFDWQVLELDLERYSIPDYLGKSKLIDTMTDVNYPSTVVYKNLTYIAACHGILHSFAHRALSDTFVMLQVLQRYEVDSVLAAALTPMVSLRAHVKKNQRSLAKDYGFRYNYDENCFVKDMRLFYAEKAMTELPFEVSVMSDI